MKKVDLLVLKAFIGPFLMTFCVVVFLHVMQFFFVYIDDFVGKGLEWYIVAELIFYLSANTIPIALPLAILLSSIMTYGNMGERYELTAMKSAGISLLQYMRASIIIVAIIGFLSLLFSNYVMPTANLKFYSTLLDITQQKPALNIRENVFYEDIENYVIKINKKAEDNQGISGVYISDRSSRRANDDIMLAKEGEMYTSKDQRYLVLTLKDGTKYEAIPPDNKSPNSNLHVRTKFSEMEKVMDLSDFKMTRTNEDLYRDHYVMMNIEQLKYYVDSLEREKLVRYERVRNMMNPYFLFLRDTSIINKISPAQAAITAGTEYAATLPDSNLSVVYTRSISFARTIKDQLEGPVMVDLHNADRFIVRAKVELNRKYMLAVACLVLLFIGAPFGALVRKGGIGYPVLFSVIFYIFYFILIKTGENIAKEEVTSPFVGMWMPTFVMLPIGIFFTYKAMRDSPFLNKESYLYLIKRILGKFRKKPDQLHETDH